MNENIQMIDICAVVLIVLGLVLTVGRPTRWLFHGPSAFMARYKQAVSASKAKADLTEAEEYDNANVRGNMLGFRLLAVGVLLALVSKVLP